jgi:hypothetical protein
MARRLPAPSRPAPSKPAGPAAAAPAPVARDAVVQKLRGPIAVVAMVGLAGLGIYDRAIFSFVLVALAPAGAAWFLDRTPRMVLVRTVLPLNVSSVAPFAFQLYYANDEATKFSEIMGNSWSWIMIGAACGIGYFLYYFLPPVIGIYITLRTEKKRRELLQRQEELKEEWGSEVGS